MSQEYDATKAVPAAVLRLLNGALRGGEFALDAGITLFVVSSPDAFHHDAGQPDFPDNAIFIPCDEGGANFEVEVRPEEDGALSIHLRDLSDFSEQQPYVANSVRRIGDLDFALCRQGDAWSEEVLTYTGNVSLPPEPSLPEMELQQHAYPEPDDSVNTKHGGKRIRIISVALVSIFLASALAAILWSQSQSQSSSAPQQTTRQAIEKADAALSAQRSQIVESSKLLTGAVGQYRILPGRDGLVYVFAADDRDAAWAQQALSRSAYADKTRIVQNSSERARVVRLLAGTERLLAYYILRLDNPARPELWLSSERAPLDAAARAALAQRMKVLLPYAEEIGIQSLSDSAIEAQAEAGLDRLGVQHKKIEHDSSVTMSIHGELADGELQKIRTFVEAFYQQWGTRYIHFSVEMEDDARKGKSFGYGSGGYVKSAASHWDFST
jgi:type III secretion system PrgH/EprH family protein